MKLEQAIKQTKFLSEYHKLHVNLLYTSAWLKALTNEKLKPFGISAEQFNVLRILKGARPTKVNLGYVADRMINKDSNASRLIDKLVLRALVDRIECPEDRRRVELSINESGVKLIDEASEQVEQIEIEMKDIDLEKVKEFNLFLEKLRENHKLT